jgi:hypothetical protein
LLCFSKRTFLWQQKKTHLTHLVANVSSEEKGQKWEKTWQISFYNWRFSVGTDGLKSGRPDEFVKESPKM